MLCVLNPQHNGTLGVEPFKVQTGAWCAVAGHGAKDPRCVVFSLVCRQTDAAAETKQQRNA